LDVLDELRIPQVGMCSVPDPWNFFDYDQPLNIECQRFECGCSAHLSHHGIKPNLEMLIDLGPENTEKYLLELTGYLHDELTSRGAHVITPRDDKRRAAIVTFDAKSAGWDSAEKLFNTLTENHINIAVRMGLVRVSPHFYNEKDEVNKFLNAVFG
jgi:selenocysteine lyase/cysteine desulfurase